MKTLKNANDATEVLERLQRLQPGSRRQWGKMSPHQMVCHLNDSFQVAFGEKGVSDRSTVIYRTVDKWIALQAPLQWPKEIKTTPEVDQLIGGTKPVEFALDVREL